jgi:hypothetical protein
VAGALDMTEVEEEAAKLLDAVREWAHGTFGPGGRLGPERISTGASECTWCPVCTAIAALRGDRPDITEKVDAAAMAVVTAVRSLLSAATDPPPPPTSTRRIQRIDLGG